MVQALGWLCSTGEVQERLPFPPGELAEMLKLCSTNFAVAVTLAAGFRLQVGLVPEHAPLQPVKESPGTAVAVSVTRFPLANCEDAEVQDGPQLMATGLLTTVPCPFPVASFCTVTVTTVAMSS